jgi:hypothetical protein
MAGHVPILMFALSHTPRSAEWVTAPRLARTTRVHCFSTIASRPCARMPRQASLWRPRGRGGRSPYSGDPTGRVGCIALEDHLSATLCHQGAEPWLRVCVVSKR